MKREEETPQVQQPPQSSPKWTEYSIPMYQCALCSVKFQNPVELIEHVEKGDHNFGSEGGEERSSVIVMSPPSIRRRSSSSLVSNGNSIKASIPMLQISTTQLHQHIPPQSSPISQDHEDQDNGNGKKDECTEPQNLVLKRENLDMEEDKLLDNLEIGPPPKPFYKCIKCPLTFISMVGLKEHRSAHSALECPHCTESFYIKPSLDRHIRERHTTLSISITEQDQRGEETCPTGNAVTSFASDVLIEGKGDGTYGCKICFKVCTARSDMSKHVRRHTNERPYSCTICRDRFKHRSAITNHMRIHTGEKPYSCHYCGKSFSQPSNKRRHEALHRGERPFTCDLCKRGFSEKTTLQTHMLQHTGERPFKCDVCKKGHITNSALNQHKKSRHPSRYFTSTSSLEDIEMEGSPSSPQQKEADSG